MRNEALILNESANKYLIDWKSINAHIIRERLFPKIQILLVFRYIISLIITLLYLILYIKLTSKFRDCIRLSRECDTNVSIFPEGDFRKTYTCIFFTDMLSQNLLKLKLKYIWMIDTVSNLKDKKTGKNGKI